MRKTLLLMAMIYSATAGADGPAECANLSGRFAQKFSFGWMTTIVATQTGCAEILLHFTYRDGLTFDRTVILDGVTRQVANDPSTAKAYFETATADPKGIWIHQEEYLHGQMSISHKESFTFDSRGNFLDTTQDIPLTGVPDAPSIDTYERY